MSDAPACVCCGAGALEPLGPLGLCPTSVLSDSRLCHRPVRLHACAACQHLQKVHGPEDQQAIRALYARYLAHHLSGGAEQPAFSEGRAPAPRTQVALERCLPHLPQRGRLLDFGCGNGAVLKSASRLLPGWELHGADLNGQHREEVLGIPGVVGFHAGGALPEAVRFDLVVMWHVLEHLEQAADVLRDLRARLAPGGRLLVSVPDVERTPYDLAVLDHVSHFSRKALSGLLARSGWAQVVDGDGWLHNCLTGLHTPASESAAAPAAGPGPDARAQVAALDAVVRRFEAEAVQGPYALFGAGMASIWLLGQLSRLPDCLVDEDPSKRGQSLHGLAIRQPGELAPATVLLPFSEGTAGVIAERLRARHPAWRGARLVGPAGLAPQAPER